MNNINKPLVRLKDSLIIGAIIDLMLLLFASFIIDTVVVFLIVFCLVVGHWIGTIVIITRRKHSLTRYDRDFIRFFSLGSAVIAFAIDLVLSHA